MIKAKLRKNAPWKTQKLKHGIILNKINFTEINDEIVEEQIKHSLKRIVEIEGETPIIIPEKKPVRKLKEPLEIPVKKKDTNIKKKDTIINITASKLKSMLKKDLEELLISTGFDAIDVKKLKKKELIEAYLINSLEG